MYIAIHNFRSRKPHFVNGKISSIVDLLLLEAAALMLGSIPSTAFILIKLSKETVLKNTVGPDRWSQIIAVGVASTYFLLPSECLNFFD